MNAERISRMRALLAPLCPSVLEIVDESHLHAGHAGAAGGAGHFRLQIVSPRFHGLTRVARHRLVYDHLADLIPGEVHALSLHTLAPDDAAAAAGTGRGSPSPSP